MQKLIPITITAALAVFAAQAVHQVAGSKPGLTGLATKLAGGIGGVWLAQTLAK
jgi:hypothetical protein